jgi:hypothetical protein
MWAKYVPKGRLGPIDPCTAPLSNDRYVRILAICIAIAEGPPSAQSRRGERLGFDGVDVPSRRHRSVPGW